MYCPKCKNPETRVLDSRETNEHREIRRRRKCMKCGFRFTTFERVESANFTVVKKDQRRESYNRHKLEEGIKRSCEKRPVTQEQIDNLINDLEEKWSVMGKEIYANQIGEDIMDALKKVDEVAYIRFASVYRHFKDIETFRKELQNLLK